VGFRSHQRIQCAWKHSAQAGVDDEGRAGLVWRSEVCQVFEEAAVDLGRALGAFSSGRKGERRGKRSRVSKVQEQGDGAPVFPAPQQDSGRGFSHPNRRSRPGAHGEIAEARESASAREHAQAQDRMLSNGRAKMLEESAKVEQQADTHDDQERRAEVKLC
jgi:putative transposase